MFTQFDLRWLTLRCNVTKEPQGPRLVPPFLLGTRQGQGTRGAGAGILPAASQEIGLTQPGNMERLLVQESRALDFLQRLLKQRQRLGYMSGQRIGVSQGRGGLNAQVGDLTDVTESEAPFEHRDCRVHVP